MKRSRTCLNLVELDAPTATPKRTCSLPNLTWNSSAVNPSFSSRQNDNDTMLLFQQHAASGMLSQGQATSCHTATTGGKSAFVMSSIVRSRGSLSEMTIHEGQQFIGEEAGSASTVAGAAGAVPQSSADSMSASGAAVFGRAAHGHGTLFDDDCDGDSSDYFCGVASSDEAEEDGSGDNVTAVATSEEGIASDFGVGSGVVPFTRQVSDAESSTSSVGQVSVSSSNGGGECDRSNAFTGESDDFIVGVDFDDCAQGAATSVSGAAGHQGWDEGLIGPSGHGPGIVPLAAVHLSSGSWRSPTTGAPRVTVRVSSPSGGGSSCSYSASRQRGATVPPPWPMAAVPPSSMMSGWSGEPSPGRSNWLRHRRPHGGLLHGHCGGSVDEEDGSLVSAGYDPSDDAKILVEMDRLRLVEPEAAGSC